MTDKQEWAAKEILRLAAEGEDLLDKGIIDIAFDRFIDIRKLADQIIENKD